MEYNLSDIIETAEFTLDLDNDFYPDYFDYFDDEALTD